MLILLGSMMRSRGIIASIVEGIESRVADRGGSRVLASNQPCRQGFPAATGRSN